MKILHLMKPCPPAPLLNSSSPMPTTQIFFFFFLLMGFECCSNPSLTAKTSRSHTSGIPLTSLCDRSPTRLVLWCIKPGLMSSANQLIMKISNAIISECLTFNQLCHFRKYNYAVLKNARAGTAQKIKRDLIYLSNMTMKENVYVLNFLQHRFDRYSSNLKVMSTSKKSI